MSGADQTTSSRLPEQQAIDALLAGDENGLRILFDEHGHGYLARYHRLFMWSFGLKYEIAEVLANEVMWRCWRSRHQFDPSKGDFKTWGYGIARRVFLSYWRAEKNNLSCVAVDEDHISALESVLDDLIASDRKNELLDFMKRNLSSKDYRVIYLKFVQGLSPAEIAEQLNELPHSISNRLHRSRRRLERLRKESLNKGGQK